MSGLRLRETFNRLLKNQYTQYLKKGVIALVLAASVSLPATANHNDDDSLTPHPSQTEHSEELRSIQDIFNQAVQDRRIILMDRDWIAINRAINDVRTDTDLRNKYLTEYLEEYGYLHINEDYFDSMSDADLFNPHSQLVGVTTDAGDKLRVCMVYGGQGEEDGATAVRNFIDVSRVMHGDEFADADVKIVPDAENFKKFVTYHEIGHCMDDWFLTSMDASNIQTYDEFQEYLAHYHRAETFADVHAVLLMARDEGVTDIAEMIANIRLAGAALSGPIQNSWSAQGSIGHYGSYIYATHRSVRAAQDYIDQYGVAALQNMSYQDIAQLASDIVNQNALNQLEADALEYLFAAQYDMSIWERLKDIEYIADRYDVALELRQELEDALRAVLDVDHIPANQSALDRLSFAGTPGEYVMERNDKVDLGELELRAEALAKVMVLQAGRNNATIDRLIEAFSENKDRWREDLSSGTDAEKEDARLNLMAAERALWLAAHEIRGTDPHAAKDVANDNDHDHEDHDHDARPAMPVPGQQHGPH